MASTAVSPSQQKLFYNSDDEEEEDYNNDFNSDSRNSEYYSVSTITNSSQNRGSDSSYLLNMPLFNSPSTTGASSSILPKADDISANRNTKEDPNNTLFYSYYNNNTRNNDITSQPNNNLHFNSKLNNEILEPRFTSSINNNKHTPDHLNTNNDNNNNNTSINSIQPQINHISSINTTTLSQTISHDPSIDLISKSPFTFLTQNSTNDNIIHNNFHPNTGYYTDKSSSPSELNFNQTNLEIFHSQDQTSSSAVTSNSVRNPIAPNNATTTTTKSTNVLLPGFTLSDTKTSLTKPKSSSPSSETKLRMQKQIIDDDSDIFASSAITNDVIQTVSGNEKFQINKSLKANPDLVSAYTPLDSHINASSSIHDIKVKEANSQTSAFLQSSNNKTSSSILKTSPASKYEEDCSNKNNNNTIVQLPDIETTSIGTKLPLDDTTKNSLNANNDANRAQYQDNTTKPSQQVSSQFASAPSTMDSPSSPLPETPSTLSHQKSHRRSASSPVSASPEISSPSIAPNSPRKSIHSTSSRASSAFSKLFKSSSSSTLARNSMILSSKSKNFPHSHNNSLNATPSNTTGSTTLASSGSSSSLSSKPPRSLSKRRSSFSSVFSLSSSTTTANTINSITSSPSKPASVKSGKITNLSAQAIRENKRLYEEFKNLDSEYHKFTSKSGVHRTNILRLSLLSFLRTNAPSSKPHMPSPVNPYELSCSIEDLLKRLKTYQRWWTALATCLKDREKPVQTSDRSAYLEAISGLASRPEWFIIHTWDQQQNIENTSTKGSSQQANNATRAQFAQIKQYQEIYADLLVTTLNWSLGKLSSLKNVPISLHAFTGKILGYSFFFVPDVAYPLLYTLRVSPENMQRIVKVSFPDTRNNNNGSHYNSNDGITSTTETANNNKSSSANRFKTRVNSSDEADNQLDILKSLVMDYFPKHVSKLIGYTGLAKSSLSASSNKHKTSSASSSDSLNTLLNNGFNNVISTKPKCPVKIPELYGPWICLWTSFNSDLFFSFFKHYYNIVTILLSPLFSSSGIDLSGSLSDNNKFDFANSTFSSSTLLSSIHLAAPGLLVLHSYLLSGLDSFIHPRKNYSAPSGNSNASNSSNGKNSLLKSSLLNSSSSSKQNGSNMDNGDFLPNSFAVNLAPVSIGRRRVDQLKYLAVVREILHNNDTPISSSYINVKQNLVNDGKIAVYKALSKEFEHIVHALTLKTSLYDVESCIVLCDFAEEFLESLILNNTKTVEPYEGSQPLKGVINGVSQQDRCAAIDWDFWFEVISKMLVESENTTTELRGLAFLFNIWDNIPVVETEDSSLSFLHSETEKHYNKRYSRFQYDQQQSGRRRSPSSSSSCSSSGPAVTRKKSLSSLKIKKSLQNLKRTGSFKVSRGLSSASTASSVIKNSIFDLYIDDDDDSYDEDSEREEPFHTNYNNMESPQLDSQRENTSSSKDTQPSSSSSSLIKNGMKWKYTEWLLSPDVWKKYFCHWHPLVRSYYLRLLCWRLASLGSNMDFFTQSSSFTDAAYPQSQQQLHMQVKIQLHESYCVEYNKRVRNLLQERLKYSWIRFHNDFVVPSTDRTISRISLIDTKPCLPALHRDLKIVYNPAAVSVAPNACHQYIPFLSSSGTPISSNSANKNHTSTSNNGHQQAVGQLTDMHNSLPKSLSPVPLYKPRRIDPYEVFDDIAYSYSSQLPLLPPPPRNFQQLQASSPVISPRKESLPRANSFSFHRSSVVGGNQQKNNSKETLPSLPSSPQGRMNNDLVTTSTTKNRPFSFAGFSNSDDLPQLTPTISTANSTTSTSSSFSLRKKWGSFKLGSGSNLKKYFSNNNSSSSLTKNTRPTSMINPTTTNFSFPSSPQTHYAASELPSPIAENFHNHAKENELLRQAVSYNSSPSKRISSGSTTSSSKSSSDSLEDLPLDSINATNTITPNTLASSSTSSFFSTFSSSPSSTSSLKNEKNNNGSSLSTKRSPIHSDNVSEESIYLEASEPPSTQQQSPLNVITETSSVMRVNVNSPTGNNSSMVTLRGINTLHAHTSSTCSTISFSPSSSSSTYSSSLTDTPLSSSSSVSIPSSPGSVGKKNDSLSLSNKSNTEETTSQKDEWQNSKASTDVSSNIHTTVATPSTVIASTDVSYNNPLPPLPPHHSQLQYNSEKILSPSYKDSNAVSISTSTLDIMSGKTQFKRTKSKSYHELSSMNPSNKSSSVKSNPQLNKLNDMHSRTNHYHSSPGLFRKGSVSSPNSSSNLVGLANGHRADSMSSSTGSTHDSLTMSLIPPPSRLLKNRLDITRPLYKFSLEYNEESIKKQQRLILAGKNGPNNSALGTPSLPVVPTSSPPLPSSPTFNNSNNHNNNMGNNNNIKPMPVANPYNIVPLESYKKSSRASSSNGSSPSSPVVMEPRLPFEYPEESSNRISNCTKRIVEYENTNNTELLNNKDYVDSDLYEILDHYNEEGRSDSVSRTNSKIMSLKPLPPNNFNRETVANEDLKTPTNNIFPENGTLNIVPSGSVKSNNSFIMSNKYPSPTDTIKLSPNNQSYFSISHHNNNNNTTEQSIHGIGKISAVSSPAATLTSISRNSNSLENTPSKSSSITNNNINPFTSSSCSAGVGTNLTVPKPDNIEPQLVNKQSSKKPSSSSSIPNLNTKLPIPISLSYNNSLKQTEAKPVTGSSSSSPSIEEDEDDGISKFEYVNKSNIIALKSLDNTKYWKYSGRALNEWELVVEEYESFVEMRKKSSSSLPNASSSSLTSLPIPFMIAEIPLKSMVN